MTVSTVSQAGRPASHTPVTSRSPNWLNRLTGSDPGLTRLRLAAQAVLTISLALLAESVFVQLTHALQISTAGAALPAAEAAAVAAQHHALLIIAMLLGAIIGMIGSFTAAMSPGPRQQLTTFVLMPVPMVGALVVGLALGGIRPLALASLVVVLAVGAYCRRFGPRGFIAGMLLFMGDFFGFFLHGVVQLAGIGWLSAEVCLGVLVMIVIHFGLFYPHQRRALARMRRSYTARSRQVAASAAALFEDGADADRAARRLERELVRLNETALMIDAQLASPLLDDSGFSATALQQRLFDAELALTNAARFAQILAQLDLPPVLRGLVRQALADVWAENLEKAELSGHLLLARLRAYPAEESLSRRARVVLRRFAASVVAFADALDAWRTGCGGRESAAASEFASPVELIGGWLPGSATVSATASAERGPRRIDRIRLAPYSRVAIQMTVAVSAAIVLGDLVSGRRFYWAVLAAFVSFMGTNNVREQVNKSFFRVLGTLIGVMAGAILAHLIGGNADLSIAVILIAVFFGMYLIRVSYVFMVIGITVMVSLLYVQLGEFSDSLLVLRLEETALGAAVTIVTVLCVFPLRTGHVIRVAMREYIEALAGIADTAARMLIDPAGSAGPEAAAARRVDATYQALVSTVKAGRLPFWTIHADESVTKFVQTAAATRHYARDMVAKAEHVSAVRPEARQQLQGAANTLKASLAALTDAMGSGAEDHTYIRSAALFDLVATRLDNPDELTPNQQVLRNLQLVDAAMAAIAHTAGLTVRDLDPTAAPAPGRRHQLTRHLDP
jgi:hypothetical protein